VLGIELDLSQDGEKDRRNWSRPSPDRIDPDRGYIKGNVIIVSWRANWLKSNATLDELQRMAEFYTALDE